MTVYRVVALAVACVIAVTPVVSAQGLMADGMKTEAKLLAARDAASGDANQGVNFQRRNPGLMWTGVGMWAAGLTLELLSFTAMKKEDGGCVYDYYGSFLCYAESGTNWPVFGVGTGLAVAGGVMWWWGAEYVPMAPAQSPVTRPGPRGKQVVFFSKSVRF